MSLIGIITAIANFLGRFFGDVNSIEADVIRIRDNFLAAKLNLEVEVRKLQQFKVDPKWRTRVINVPMAAEQIQDLYHTILDGVREDAAELHRIFDEFVAIWKSESQPDPQDPGGQVKGITKASVKIGHVVTLVNQLAQVSEKIQHFIDLVRKLREQLEGLDALFLQQGNSRRSERLVAGGSIRIRIGSLHE